jgi:hypothetical protein
MADLFNLISAGIPYESLVKKIGGVAPQRRSSVVKLLGDSSLIPSPHIGVSVIGPAGNHPSSGSARRQSMSVAHPNDLHTNQQS